MEAENQRRKFIKTTAAGLNVLPGCKEKEGEGGDAVLRPKTELRLNNYINKPDSHIIVKFEKK
ncbi:MAG TPA: hypothetical protein VNZ49_03065 [Bacteroidia bacterium]|jgi:hypothetical protein|nr:hypothetical protein [Bacteroidia bacterium]